MTRDEPFHNDLRVQRTRKLIVEALIELTVEKGFAAVTVQDIVRRAGINRATFYRHYEDKFDLLDQYVQAVYELPDSSPGPGAPAGGDVPIERIAAGLVRLLEHVREHAAFFRVMLGQKGDPAFADKIRQHIQSRLRRLLPEALRPDEKSAELYLNFCASGALGVLTWWLEHEMPYSPEQLAAMLYRLVAAELQSLRQGTS